MATTPYTETEVLLAILNKEFGHAHSLIRDMSQVEKVRFIATLAVALDVANQEYDVAKHEFHNEYWRNRND